MRRNSERAGLPGWWVVLGCLAGLVVALATGMHRANAQPAPAPTTSATGEPSEPGEAAPEPAPADSAEAPAPAAAPSPRDHGLAPMYQGEMVPLEWMPPGSNASPIPSDEIFPPQTLTIRFNHKKHVKEFKQGCKVCHAAAYGSSDSKDRLMPDPTQTCDNCHDSDHSNLNNVVGGTEDENGQCGFCHLGESAGADGKVAKLVIPEPNLRMNHKAHLDRNIECAQCHGMIDELELATREQLPRMAGCFTCHAKSGPAAGDARGHCNNCHITEPSGRLETTFSTGWLQPPEWLHGADHGPDWIHRHKAVAGANSEMCASCHSEKFCVDCHDGRVRPRNVHPNDWISMHPQAARQDNPRCVSCHNLQQFCGDCHRRVGVARDTASANRLAGRRFHPPPQVWTTAPRSTRHHAWEAMRNLNACVGCHTERDCTTCHATKGVSGGAGITPHPPGFGDRCGTAFSRNPRPCLVCHASNDPVLAPCR